MILDTDYPMVAQEINRRRQALAQVGWELADATQEVYLRMLRRPTHQTGAYRRLDIRRIVIDVIRTKSVKPLYNRSTGAKNAFALMPSREGLKIDDPDYTPTYDDPWLSDRLKAALATLPPSWAETVWAHVVDEVPLQEICRQKGMNKSWAWEKNTKGLAALKERLTCV